MKLSRLGVAALVVVGVFVGALGACNDDDDNVACGNGAAKIGTCQGGPTCGTGTVELVVSEPSDQCAQNGVSGNESLCCIPTPTGGGSLGTFKGYDVPSPVGVHIAGSADSGFDVTLLPPFDAGGGGDATPGDTGTDAPIASEAGSETGTDATTGDGSSDGSSDGGGDAAKDGSSSDAATDGASDASSDAGDAAAEAGGDGGSDAGNDGGAALGTACLTDDTCGSGHCSDGVCCDTACTGTCQACSVALNGAVNGTCSDAVQGTTCGAASCSMGALTAVSTCDGSGVCTELAAVPCVGGFNCATPTTCGGPTCANNSDCVSNNCVAGACL